MNINESLQLDKSLAFLNDGKVVSDFSILSESMFAEFNDSALLFESNDLEIVTEKFSLKSVWEAIKKVFEKIKKFISEWIGKLKNLLKSKKTKMLENKCDDLEKKLKASEADKIKLSQNEAEAKAEAQKWKDKLDEVKKEWEDDARETDEQNLKAIKHKNDQIDTWMDRAKTFEGNATKAQVELVNANAKLVQVGSEIINNNYLYFDIYDYFKNKNIDPQRVVRCNPFKDLINMGNNNRNNERHGNFKERWEAWKSSHGEDMNQFDPKIFGTDNLSGGGYSHVDVNNAIRKHLDEKKKVETLNDLTTLAKHCKWLLHGYQVSAMNECMGEYQRAIGSIEKNMQKYFNYDNNDYDTNEGINGEENLDPVLQAMKEYVRMLDNNVRMFAVLSDYAGRAVGAASAAVIALEKCYGIDFKSDEYKFY